MKRLILLFTLLISCVAKQELRAQSCCAKPADMQLLAFNDEFKASHLPPVPFEYTPAAGSKMISFPTPDGGTGKAYYVPATEASDKVLFIFHEWWGLNDYIKKEAEYWHDQLDGHIAVYAIDLYDGKVAANADEAGKLMGGLKQQRGEAIISGLLRKIGKQVKVATLGWCMGGTWSFNAALLAGPQCKAAVMYYGFPEKEAKRIQMLQADLLYIRGAKDKFITEESVINLGKAVKENGREFEYHSYDADHAFANPSNPQYDKEHTQEADEITLRFLRQKLEL
ncbi:dienelactone hydrolase family protein [Chitinophagaceae bacterium MMS25-I14]